MKLRYMWCVVALGGVLGCGQQESSQPADRELEALLPELSSRAQWSISEGPVSHTPDNLWEYLDGGAPQYLAYGFEKMIHIRYQLGDDPLASIAADVYDMGSELGAFGIYSSIRPPTAAIRSWGAEGYRSGAVAAGWKGTVFVHVAADDDRPELIEMLEGLMSEILDRVVGSDSPPPVLRPLPPDGLVPHSERYVAADLHGHAALGGGVLAIYEIDGRRSELFFSELESETAAAAALTTVRSERERWTEEVMDHAAAGEAGFRFEDPGAGSGLVVRSGRYVAGVQGDLPLAAQEALLASLTARLP